MRPPQLTKSMAVNRRWSLQRVRFFKPHVDTHEWLYGSFFEPIQVVESCERHFFCHRTQETKKEVRIDRTGSCSIEYFFNAHLRRPGILNSDVKDKCVLRVLGTPQQVGAATPAIMKPVTHPVSFCCFNKGRTEVTCSVVVLNSVLILLDARGNNTASACGLPLYLCTSSFDGNLCQLDKDLPSPRKMLLTRWRWMGCFRRPQFGTNMRVLRRLQQPIFNSLACKNWAFRFKKGT